jgi:glycosyltransferase involved in cell wall biosynthesis
VGDSEPQTVVAVVVTHNRKELLIRCLEALAAQSHAVSEVVLVDSASTDGTIERVEQSGLADRIPIRVVRLRRNGGGAEGFHYGVREALALESDWLWLMDDDSEPRRGAIAEMLRSPRAREPETALLAPVVEDRHGRVLSLNRGHLRPRWFFAPLVAASPEQNASGETQIDFCSFVGPLVRTDAARRIEPPMREMFIRFEDLEYVSRLRGRMWLIAASRTVHHDPRPVAAADFREMWADYSQPVPFAEQWKRLYGVRNLLYCGFRDGYIGPLQAVSQVLVQAVRTLAFHDQRLLTLRLLARYGLDGWRGRFRNVPPARWPELAGERQRGRLIEREELSYDEDVSEPAKPLSGAPSRPTPAA